MENSKKTLLVKILKVTGITFIISLLLLVMLPIVFADTITEKVKVSNGNDLFKFVQGKDLRIRDKCSEPFVMRGSYHILSNQLKVGWHTDFFERLKYLLEN